MDPTPEDLGDLAGPDGGAGFLGDLASNIPGIDEAMSFAEVMRQVNSMDYETIVFDTAPTGHTLRLLTLPDFFDATLGKVVRLRQMLTGAADAVKGLFGVKADKDPAVVAMEGLRGRMEEARALFRDSSRNRFVIVTIPTVMAAAESARLAASLRQEGIPINTLVVNQVGGPAHTRILTL